MNNIRKLAFIGGGNMAAALIGGLIKRGLPRERIVVADPSREQLDRLVRDLRRHAGCRQRGGGRRRRGGRSGGQAAADAQRRTRPGAAPRDAAGPLVISVAAGIPHAALTRWFGTRVPVVRTMPNRPALNGFGATGLYAPDSVGAANRALAETIMAAVSATVWVEHESQMDTVTALSGSGPAYFFLFMEALEAAAHARGLPNDVAHKLTLETAFGASQMARLSNESAGRAAGTGHLQRRHHRRGARRFWMPRAFVLSSHTPSPPPTAARPSWRRSSAPRETPAPDELKGYGSDQIHRRYVAVAADARVPAAAAVSSWCARTFGIRWRMRSCA